MDLEYGFGEIVVYKPSDRKCNYCKSIMLPSAETIVKQIKKPVPPGAVDLNIMLGEEKHVLINWICSGCQQKLQNREDIKSCSCGSSTIYVSGTYSDLPDLLFPLNIVYPLTVSYDESEISSRRHTSYRCTKCEMCQVCAKPIGNGNYIMVWRSEDTSQVYVSTSRHHNYYHISCAGPDNALVQKWIEDDRVRVTAENIATKERSRELDEEKLGIGPRPGCCKKCRKPLSLLDKWNGRTKHSRCS